MTRKPARELLSQTDSPHWGGSVRGRRTIVSVLLLASAAPGFAQPTSQAIPEIVVIGERAAALRPQRSIGGEDLLVYGAATVRDLLDEVAADDGERAGSITVLVNGRRVTGLGDIETYPAEAIERLDILPRESGARLGAPPARRVYNIVLKSQVRIGTARGRGRVATEGGTIGTTVDLGATRIKRPQRLNVALELRRDGALFESERDVEQAAGAPPALGRARTLRPATRGAELTLSGADQLRPGVDGLVTLKLGELRTRSSLGLSDLDTRIGRVSRSRTFDLATQLNVERGSWLLTLDGGYRATRRATSTTDGDDARRVGAVTRAKSIELLAHGPLIRLPAGSVHLTLGAGLRGDSVDRRARDGVSDDVARASRDVRAGIDVPLLSRAGPLSGLGDLAVRADVSRGRTGGDRLRSSTLSARWSPVEPLQLSATLARSRTAPAIDLLGEPLIETSGVRYFDPLRLETVDLVTVAGGRRDLPPQFFVSRRLTADLRPVKALDLLLTAEFAGVRNTNVISALPPASDLVIRLFPERFERDAAGMLTRIDLRPVIFQGQRESQLRTAFSLGVPLGKGRGRPRLQVAGSYRLLLNSRLDPGGGLERVDLLDRQSISLGGAMRPRHQFDFSLGYAERGLGVRLTGERRARSFLAAGGPDEVLTFGALTILNLRTFVDGRRIAAGSATLRNARFGLSVNNLFNRREQVRGNGGRTILAYQPALRDPLGRSIEFEFRKTF
jgi:hypothetical protein